MQITWEIEDGYAGGSRPQYTEIPDSELENCGGERERRRLIESYVQDDFNQNISWVIVHMDAD